MSHPLLASVQPMLPSDGWSPRNVVAQVVGSSAADAVWVMTRETTAAMRVPSNRGHAFETCMGPSFEPPACTGGSAPPCCAGALSPGRSVQ
jgi:hypothetical protein